jgi:MFS family permease
MATEIATPVEPVERFVAAPVTAARVPRRWRNLAAITGVEVVDSAEAGLVNTLFPAIATALRLDSGHLGLLSALGKLVSVPFGPAWVWLAGRIGRKSAMIATTVTGGIFGTLAGFSEGFLALLIFNTLMSACVIGGQPIANAIIADAFDDKSRGIASGYFYAAITAVASFIGPVLALFTGTEDGWRYGMWTIGGICIVAALAITAFYRDPGVGASEPQLAGLPERERTTPVTVGSVMSLFRTPTYSIMML